MKAGQLTAPRRLDVVDVPIPELEPGKVLVRLQTVSICGSDLEPFSRPFPRERYPFKVGMPGHECAGVVEESRCAEVKPGQRVIVLPSQRNGLQEYLVEPPARIVQLPADGDLATLLMCQPWGTVLYSCMHLGNVVGKSVAVLGQGAIGLGFVHFLSNMGAREVIAIDLLEYRLALSRRLGATMTVNAQQEDTDEAIRELTNAQGVDVTVEAATGKVHTINQAIHITQRQGLVVQFGVPSEERIGVDVQALFDKELTWKATASSRSGNEPWAVRQAVNLLSQGRLDPSPLVTHRMRLEDVQAAHLLYEERREGVIKVVMEV
jgi:alcohol dehydrogenase